MRVILADLKLISFLVLISFFVYFSDILGVLEFPKSILQFLTIPIQQGLYQSGTSLKRQFEFVFLVRQASLENKALKKQLGDLYVENSELRKKLTEKEILELQQNSLNPQTFHLIPARVIGIGRYLTLDKGSQDGVKLGQTVVYKDNYIGKVKEVNPKSAYLILAQDPDSKLAVYAQNKDGKARGILTGQFGSDLLMDKILHQEPVEENDLVYSEGTEGQLPRGLIMGRVFKVNERQNEIFKQAEVKPVFELSDLEIVFVVPD